jgi:hypothetical protein
MMQSQDISSFTAIKGAMVAETYAVLAEWDLARSLRDNLETSHPLQILAGGSEKRAADITRVISRRFDLPGRDAPLVPLARQACPIEVWKPILLWHIAERDALLRLFLEEWLFESYRQGRAEVTSAPVAGFIAEQRQLSGAAAFSDATAKRAAGGLLKIAADFGLTEGGAAHRFRPYTVPDYALLYVLHAISERHPSGRMVVEAKDWRRFLMAPQDVERELFRLHQFHQLDYQVAGTLAQLTLPCASALDFVERHPP